MASKTTFPDNHDIVLRGGCRCGNITYTSTTMPTDIANCHCRACQQMSGGPYIAWADFPASSIKWFSVDTSVSGDKIPGESAIVEYSSNNFAIRGFCSDCGSTIRLWYKCDPGRYSIAVGSIDESSVQGGLPNVKKHIFLVEKASWEVLGDDGLERHQGFSEEGIQQKIDEWVKAHGKRTSDNQFHEIEHLEKDNTWPN